ncbi:hypothetical protein BDQ17DRAFT_1333030 [Cyathus striatus]|nr:hypothetical protein BDQ17DRAFT_1333030 [Cyathus striatus]
MSTTSHNMNGPFSGAHNFQIFGATFTDDSTSKEDKRTAQSSLNRIRNWGNRADGPRVLWLCGPVGAGKSTISQTMADEWIDSYPTKSEWSWLRTILASTRDQKYQETREQIPLILTLAYQIATWLPDVQNHIISAIKRKPSLINAAMETQFREFILKPLRDVENSLIVLIDALDECKNPQVQIDFLKIVTFCTLSENQASVKFFIASRPEHKISRAMREITRNDKEANFLEKMGDFP